jgi:hypothetical protein
MIMDVWGRWIAVVLVAIALGVAGLERSAGTAAERRTATAIAGSASSIGAIASELPTAAEVGQTEPSVQPRLTY